MESLVASTAAQTRGYWRSHTEIHSKSVPSSVEPPQLNRRRSISRCSEIKRFADEERESGPIKQVTNNSSNYSPDIRQIDMRRLQQSR
mmetsp:Transcript_33453/g.80995  ORF Transcript_33453/g.80995 Transcript_33453/m.80995 type:complete len:88 (-) Transcript_33453:22-285(-)